MKRAIMIGTLLLCALLLACAAPLPDPDASAVVVSAPKETDVTLTLPLRKKGDTTTVLDGYTDGFVSGSGKLLTFSTETEDPTVALSSLFEDGSLCILALHEGKTVIRVTAVSETGESATARVNVTVKNARRIAVLLVVGVLAVALFILFGQPNKKRPEPEAIPKETETTEETPSERS